MPVIKVWCLPADLSEERLRELHKAIVGAAVRVHELGLRGEDDMVTLFPKDMMSYGLGTEIVIEVTELCETPESTDEVRKKFARHLVSIVKVMFPNAQVMSYITPYRPANGFCVSPAGLNKIWIDNVQVEELIDLRHRILRERLPVSTAHFDGDDYVDTHHFGLFFVDQAGNRIGNLISCASFMFNAHEGKSAWQLRGMATETYCQGFGLGKRLIHFAEEYLKRIGWTDLVWCNAREPAVKFYEKNGWKCVSDAFDIPTAGPHRKMLKQLKQRRD